MMRYIILLLLLSSTLTAQTKLRQIERSATKWHVPAAWDSIPGVTGHAMKYIDLETLMDTVGIQQFGIDSLDYRNDSLLIWVGGGYYFAIIPQGSGYLDPYVVSGDTVGFILQTVQDTVEFIGASTGGGGGGGSGTVTSVAIANGGGISVSGSPITTSGTITLTAADQSATNEIQQIDTFQVVGSQLRLSLTNDGEAYKAVTLPSGGGGGGVDTIIAGDGIKVTNTTGDYTIEAKGAQYAQLSLSSAIPTLSSIALSAATWTDVAFLQSLNSTELTGVIQAGTDPDYITVSVGGTCEVSYDISIIAAATSQLYAAVWTSNGSTQIHNTKSWTHAGSTTNDRYVSLSGSTIIPCIASESFKLQVYSNVFQSGVVFGHQRLIVKKIK